MADEIEAKIKIIEPTVIESLVRHLGGVERFRRIETNIFYDQARKLDKKGEVLRLRQEYYLYRFGDGAGEVVSATFKGRRKKGKLKIRPEHEFEVSDFDQARAMFEALGYKESFRFEKKRQSFSLGDCVVEIDTLPYLGHYVEIEGGTEKKINKVVKQLGLDGEKLIVEGYGGLLRKDAQKNKRSLKVAVFKSKASLL